MEKTNKMGQTAHSRDYFEEITIITKDPITRCVSFQTVSDKSGIPVNILRISYRRENGQLYGNFALTEDEELTLVCAINALTLRKDPHHCYQRICEMATDIFAKFHSEALICANLKGPKSDFTHAREG